MFARARFAQSHHAQPDDRQQQALLDQAHAGSLNSREELLVIQLDWIVFWFEAKLPAQLQSKLDADDLAQEAQLVAWELFPKFQGSLIAEYRGWITRICQSQLSCALRHYGAACRALSREEPLDEATVEPGKQRPWQEPRGSDISRPDFAVAYDQESPFLAGLPHRTRYVVVQHARDGRLFSEIARELRCSPRTVRRAWRQALAELQRRGPGAKE